MWTQQHLADIAAAVKNCLFGSSSILAGRFSLPAADGVIFCGLRPIFSPEN
jgi:hypothetical protein